MNLELLDPFKLQIPDRVDATLHLPAALHFQKKESSSGKSNDKSDKSSSNSSKKSNNNSSNNNNDNDDDQDRKAANHVAFNRRGGYIAVGFGSGTVAVFDVLSRTLSALYRGYCDNDDESGGTNNNNNNNHGSGNNNDKNNSGSNTNEGQGVTSVSWSRRSRTLLAGAAADTQVRLVDTTHPLGPEECCLGIVAEDCKDTDDNDGGNQSVSGNSTKAGSDGNMFQDSSFAEPESAQEHFKKARQLSVVKMSTGKDLTIDVPTGRKRRHSHIRTSAAGSSIRRRYPILQFHLPLPIGSSLQVHPRDTTAGLAALEDGSLVAFWIPKSAWEESDESTTEQDESATSPKVKIATIFNHSSHFITSASFCPRGDKIYAATKQGYLLGFEVGTVFDHLASEIATLIPAVKPSFTILIPGGATVWHLLVSRNGRYLVINSADAALRLYATKECWTTPEEVEKPVWVFQDVVSKVKFASCDISGDAEFVVGGANGNEDKYELYIWNTSTGALMDKLTGAAVELYSVAWHPTRSFVAVATSDGLVDIWGPRINWTAFAPDFQALPQNVEYVEREDEFDIVEGENGDEPSKVDDDNENEFVDVISVEPVPVFASDSEDEEEVFCFETKIKNIVATRGKNNVPSLKPVTEDG